MEAFFDPRFRFRSENATGERFARVNGASLGECAPERPLEHLDRAAAEVEHLLVDGERELPGDYLDQPAPDPAQFGLATEDDGSRDAALSGNMTMPPFEPDAQALRGSPVRIVPAIGEAGEGAMARRGGEALAALLGVTPAVFPGDHGGFAANQWSPHNGPGAFAHKLREVLE